MEVALEGLGKGGESVVFVEGREFVVVMRVGIAVVVGTVVGEGKGVVDVVGSGRCADVLRKGSMGPQSSRPLSPKTFLSLGLVLLGERQDAVVTYRAHDPMSFRGHSNYLSSYTIFCEPQTKIRLFS